MKIIGSRAFSYLVLAGVYLAAFCVAAIVWRWLLPVQSNLPDAYLWPTLGADAAATLFVWLVGLALRNSSVYDPYWSVAPPVIAIVWAGLPGVRLTPAIVLTIAVILLWSLRLTGNWALRWTGFDREDWRYAAYRRNGPVVWHLANLFGIHLMPTLLVFAGMVPVCFALDAQAVSSQETSSLALSPLAILGAAAAVAAVAIEWIADFQMDRFRKREGTSGGFVDEGLWKYSRHPNYFGEVLFWWSLWAMQAGIAPTPHLFVGTGAILITLLFLFVSVPMMERRNLATRPGYADYKRKVSMLVPFFRRGEAKEGGVGA
jgi:steroid 5-alpha reductase family enzyme